MISIEEITTLLSLAFDHFKLIQRLFVVPDSELERFRSNWAYLVCLLRSHGTWWGDWFVVVGALTPFIGFQVGWQRLSGVTRPDSSIRPSGNKWPLLIRWPLINRLLTDQWWHLLIVLLYQRPPAPINVVRNGGPSTGAFRIENTCICH